VEKEVDEDGLGDLTLECFIEGASDLEALALVEEYKQHCRIYNALKDSLTIVFLAHGDQLLTEFD
jgi:hypothetical protein